MAMKSQAERISVLRPLTLPAEGDHACRGWEIMWPSFQSEIVVFC